MSDIEELSRSFYNPVNAMRSEGRRIDMEIFGTDFYALKYGQLLKKYKETNFGKRIWHNIVENKRKQCMVLGLRVNAIIRCPFCGDLVHHLGYHLQEYHSIFFFKCPYCEMDFDAPDFTPL